MYIAYMMFYCVLYIDLRIIFHTHAHIGMGRDQGRMGGKKVSIWAGRGKAGGRERIIMGGDWPEENREGQSAGQ